MIHSDRFSVYVNNNAGIDPPPSHLVNIPVNPPYQHHSVNHRRNFVDPLTRAHTNHVEGFWNNWKKNNKAMCSTTVEMLPSYLDEFQWRQIYGKKTVESFNNILEQISNFYPVNIWFSISLITFFAHFCRNYSMHWLINNFYYFLQKFFFGIGISW